MADELLFDSNIRQFDQFLLSIGQVLSDEREVDVIQKKLRRHFNTTSTSYLSSKEFRLLLDQTQQSFAQRKKSTKYFKLLCKLDEQLVEHTIKPSKKDHSFADIYDSETDISPTDKKPAIKSSIASAFEKTNKYLEVSETNQSKTLTDTVDSSDSEAKQTRKIEKLERRLARISETINQLEQQEMSLDEMKHSDLYHVEAKLKKQACEIYTRLTTLKKQPSSSLNRILNQSISLADAEIDHPSINGALEKMVNQTRYLPSFGDVLETVEKANDQYQLSLGVEGQKAIAEKAFKIIGLLVKTRRMADFDDIMASRLPESFNVEENDPALKSQELENTLLKNEQEAVLKTQQIFEKFSQIDPGSESEMDADESSEDSSDDSDDDEIESASDHNINECQCDVLDVIPPVSPQSLTTERESQFNASASGTASIPSLSIQRTVISTATSNRQSPLDNDDDIRESQPILVIPRRLVHTTPTKTTTESFFSLFEKRMNSKDTSSLSKRALEDETDSTKAKRSKPPSDNLTLD